jgi:integrase/recombinase XerC
MQPNNIIAEFEQALNQQDISPLTRRGYLQDLRQFGNWFEQNSGEPFAPEAVTPTDIREYRQYLQVTLRRKANSINRKLAAISAFFRWAMKAGLISSDPTKDVKSVRQTTVAPRWLTKQEQYALQRAIEKDLQLSKLRYPKRWVTRRRDASLTLFLLNTGLRLSEARNLAIEDIQISERKGSLLVRNGKGNKQRRVPLNSQARKAVQEWLEVRPETASEYLWVAVEGEVDGLSGRAIQRILARYGQETGLEGFTPHVARHTFAKNLVDSGVGLEKVASLLGHANLNTTRVYITPSEHDLELAVEKLGD